MHFSVEVARCATPCHNLLSITSRGKGDFDRLSTPYADGRYRQHAFWTAVPAATRRHTCLPYDQVPQPHTAHTPWNPRRTSCRTRSVSDLRAPAVYGGFEVKDAVAAAAAAGGWRAAAAAGQHLVEEDGGAAAASQDPFTSIASAADGTPPGSVAVTPGGGGAHCRMALGSAPAAPRGMLGLALGAMKPPAAPSGVAAAAGGSRGRGGVIVGSASAHGAWGDAGGKAVAVAAEGEEVPPGSEPKDAAAAAEGDSGGGGGAGGTSTALTVTVVQRNVTAPAAVAAAGAAGASPPGRPGAGAMVVARPGGVAVGSLAGYGSPQLPFAFTPSAASMSLASLHQVSAGGAARVLCSGRHAVGVCTSGPDQQQHW